MSRTDAVENILRLLRADPSFSSWARSCSSLDAMWEACAEPAWMLWLLRDLEYGERGALRRFAVACARHVGAPGEGALSRALDVAARVADGHLSEQELSRAYREARAHAEALSSGDDFNQSMAARAAACVAAVRARPIEAATEASREALRAISWDLGAPRGEREEAAWQAGELRRLTVDSIAPTLDRARARGRGKLALI